MTLPSGRDWLFAGKAYLAAMLALYIALAWDMPRPYWAMTTVYIVMNPLSGATASKAIFRACGTILGAIAAVVLVPNLVNTPELLVLAIALWTGTLLYLSLLDRTPRSYVFMLAGYTLPLIALPALGEPGTIFDVTTARTQEILLGITCAAVVSAVVFPVSIGPVLAGRISTWLHDAGAWAQEILRGEDATPVARQRLAADIAAMDMLISQISYDAQANDMAGQARELRGRLLLMLPVLSSLSDRMHALRLEADGLPPELRELTAQIAEWMGTGAGLDVPAILARLDALEPTAAQMRSWKGLVTSSLVARLREVVELWRDCLAQRQDIAAGQRAPARGNNFRGRRLVGSNRHYDHVMMAVTAGSTVLAIFTAGLIWIHSGWTGGANFMAIASVACCFFGAADRPVPMMRSMFVWGGVAMLGAGLFLFTVMPAVHDFELLALCLAPPFLLIGLMMPRPQTFMIAMNLSAVGAGSLALTSRYNIDFASYVNENIAVQAGVLFALVWTMATKPFGAALAARRLARAGWADLAALAAGTGRGDHSTLAGRMLDRLGQLTPRLGAEGAGHLASIDGLAELRIGYNVLDLQRDRRRLPPMAKARIDEVLAGVSAHFRDRIGGGPATPPEALLGRIDEALKQTAREADRPIARDAVQALVGLRRGFFPLAPGPREAAPANTPQAAAA